MKRTILVEGKEVTGTCRAFARQENVEGFTKCETFCKFVDKSGTVCEVDGRFDSDCDGVPDLEG